MDPNWYRNFLISRIPGAKPASGGKEVECRCFFCTDGKDRNHGHFYLKIPMNEGDLPVYNCVKCHTHGLVTPQKLMEWNLYDVGVALEVAAYTKQASKQLNYALDADYIYRLTNRITSRDELSYQKLAYINNRIGTNLSFEELEQNKIVLNLNDVLNQNRITDLTRHPNIISQLDSSFLGFISYDNAFINLRRTVPEGVVYEGIDKRYVNYNIFNKQDNSHKFYIPPAQVNLLNPAPIKVHIAEGPFDILSIKYNMVAPQDRNQAIFAAVTGSGYKGVLRFLISNLKLMNLEIHIYRDNDMDWYILEDIAYYLSGFGYHIIIHSNTHPGEKDFGVRPDHIRETIQII